MIPPACLLGAQRTPDEASGTSTLEAPQCPASCVGISGPGQKWRSSPEVLAIPPG